MHVQLYNDGTLRIFKRARFLCDMQCSPLTKSIADKQLKRLNMVRKGNWKDADWGHCCEAVLINTTP